MTTATRRPRTPPAERRRAAEARRQRSLFDPAHRPAGGRSTPFASSTRAMMARNPVMFVVEVGSVLTTILFLRDLGSSHGAENLFAGLVAAWLWFTVLFANFAEAMAEGRGKAQADTLRKARSETVAHVPPADGAIEEVPEPAARRSATSASSSAGEMIPGDGEIVEGIASRRRVGHHRRVGPGDPRVRRRPLGGHRRHPGAVGPDRRAHHRQAGRDLPRPHDRPGRRGRAGRRRPNEIALNILLAGLTLIFLLAIVTLQPFAIYSRRRAGPSSCWSPCSCA